MKERRKNLLKYAQKMDCDTLVTFEPENLFYMTGFWDIKREYWIGDEKTPTKLPLEIIKKLLDYSILK